MTENARLLEELPSKSESSEQERSLNRQKDKPIENSKVVKFTLQEISQMAQTLKKAFIANGLAARVIKRKSGKDSICYEIRYRANGYNITASSKSLEKAKIKFIEKTKLKEIEKYRVKTHPRFKDTLENVFKEWFDYKEGTVSEKERQRYYSNFMKLPEELTRMPIGTIKTVNISKVMKDVKPRKYEELRTLFNGIFTYAIASGIITHNPIALIRFKKAERQNRDSLNKEKIDLFFRRIQLPEFEPIRQGAYLLYFFGLRPCEVDEETRREGSFLIARNRKRKNGKIEYKKIPIPKQAEDFINWDEPLIFNCTSSWKQNQLFKAIFNDDETTAYNFRHTFSTICQENGVSRDIVEIWIGDSPQRLIGKVYTHFSDEFMQEQMYKVKFPTFKQE